jgi:cell division septal protein FtsQ
VVFSLTQNKRRRKRRKLKKKRKRKKSRKRKRKKLRHLRVVLLRLLPGIFFVFIVVDGSSEFVLQQFSWQTK